MTSKLGSGTIQTYQVNLAKAKGVFVMNKDEILKKAQTEGKEKDLPDLEAQKSGAWLAYIIGVLLLIAVDTVNGFVLHYVNRGADFALFTMAFVVFLIKYIKLRKRHELIVAIIWGVLAASMLAVWIMQLAGVM